MRGHELPQEKLLNNYRKFREWWDLYQKDPDIGENPYKKYSFGFSNKS